MDLMPKALSLLARTKQPCHALVAASWHQSSGVKYLLSQLHALAVVLAFMAWLLLPIINLSSPMVMAFNMVSGSLEALRCPAA